MDLMRNQGGSKRLASLMVFRSVGILVAVALIGLLLFPATARATGLRGAVVVNASSLNLRQSASTSARVLKTLYRGDVVRVISDAGSWCKVSTSAGIIGWCQSGYFVNYSSSAKPSNNAMLDWPSEYISLTANFTVNQCWKDMGEIAAGNAGMARIEIIGTSLMGNPLKAIVIGNPDAQTKVFVQAAIHAREWLTALLALRQAEAALKAAKLGASYKGVSISRMLQNIEIWVVPEANPDGVRLCMEGLSSAPASMQASLKSMNGGSTSFTRWKANGRGVDLNRNFSAGFWEDPNYRKPGPYYYGGPYPFSEPESVALRDLSLAKDFALSMSYHSSGEMTYWYNHTGAANKMNRYIAEQIKLLNGYSVLSPSSQSPGGGYRDWFAEKFRKPAFTLEVGRGYCPLPQSSFPEYWQDNRFVLYELLWASMPKGISKYERVTYINYK